MKFFQFIFSNIAGRLAIIVCLPGIINANEFDLARLKQPIFSKKTKRFSGYALLGVPATNIVSNGQNRHQKSFAQMPNKK
jgi:hypothetical protein